LRSDATAIATGSEEFNGFLEWLESNIEQLRPISDGENDALEEAIATIHANADGSISVEVDADVEVDEMGGMDMDMEPGMEPGMDMGPGMDDETAGMEPVDAIAADTPMPEPAADAMPDFENMDDEGPVDGEVPEGPVGDEDQPNFGGPVGDEDDEDEEDEEVAEDKDITHPQSTKYNKHTKDNKRDMPKVKMPKASSDKLDSVGPSLKKDDGSGTKPPVARKGDN